MSIELWIAFVVASSVLLAIPGPTILTVISYSLVHGKGANIPLVAAVALGDAIALIFSLAGLGAILATSAWMFSAVKVLGGLYLIYLGFKQLRAGRLSMQSADTELIDSKWRLFFNTTLVTALNPKSIIFFIAFLPQFINPLSNLASQLWILSLTFVVLASLITFLYAVLASNARQLLDTSAAYRRVNVVGGSLLTIAGVWALIAAKPS